MDKIGIITFHNVINYGAVLQAYSLQKYLSKNGYDCEIIDYLCSNFKSYYKIFKLHNKSVIGLAKALIRMPYLYKKRQRFKNFEKKYMKLSFIKYNSNNIHYSNKIYNVFITGSDQVWNLELTGNDKNYFLDFVENNKKRISYAASIGKAQFSTENENYIKNILKYYNAISVREDEAKKYIKKITGYHVTRVLDPVFLLDEKEWLNLASYKSDKYILLYVLHEESAYQIAKRLSNITGLKIVCLQNNLKKYIKAEYRFIAGPTDFLTLINNAEYIVTDSFHGVAFGVIFRKNIKIILKKQLLDLNSRIQTLVEVFGLENSIVNESTNDSCLIMKTDYTNMEEKINQEITYSKQYLLNTLGGKSHE